jgi:putative acetyltransferase
MAVIRRERPEDGEVVRAVLVAAFPADEEARLVEALRASGHLHISLVAEEGGQVVGHVAFSPIELDGEPDGTPASAAAGLGLAPLAVAPQHQRRGLGGQLVRAGLAAAARPGTGYVVVLGHPDYYPRFGFRRASTLGLRNEYGADDAFLVVELRPGALPRGGGLVRYGPEFAPWASG